jgi:hypothetical protein
MSSIVELQKKKNEVAISRMRLKKDEFEIKKIELEHELHQIVSKIKEMTDEIMAKQKELGLI